MADPQSNHCCILVGHPDHDFDEDGEIVHAEGCTLAALLAAIDAALPEKP